MTSYQLPNGLRIVTHSDLRIRNSVVSVLYGVGSAHEKSSQTGLAHFLEHMMFEGTRDYPDFDTSMQTLMAENNAFTGQDYTCYYEVFPNEHLEAILRLEKDRMSHLNMTQNSVDAQRSVIVEEFKETSLNPPLSDAWHYIQEICFDNTYSWPVIGKSIEHVKKVEQSVLVDFYESNYKPKNAVLSIVSNRRDDDVLEICSRVFNQQSSMEAKSSINISTSSKLIGEKQVLRKNIANPCFYLAMHVDDYGSKDYFTADLVSGLLTNGESSILYQNLVIRSKFCTEIQSYLTDNRTSNLLVIEGKLSQNIGIEQVFSLIKKCFSDIREGGLSRIQYETVINKSRTYWAFNLYSSMNLAQNMAIFQYCLQTDDVRTYIQSMFREISKTDIEDFIRNELDYDKFSRLTYLPI